MERCEACGFKAKNRAGLGSHRRARHPEMEVVELLGLSEAVASGERAEVLRALQRLLANELEGAIKSEVVAPLVRTLTAVTRELAEIAPKEEQSRVDEIASRRARRRAKASGS